MSRKIKILFVSQHVIHSSTFQAGHKSFGYYLSKFCNDEAFDVGYVVDHNNDDSFYKMKSEYNNARDFSISTPKFLKALKHLFYNDFLRLCFSLINPSWVYLDPCRSFLYKKALRNVKVKGWLPDIIALEWTEVIFLSKHCKNLFPKAVQIATEHDVSFNKLNRQYENNFVLKNLLLDRFKNKELSTLKGLDLVIVLSTTDRAILEENLVDKKKILLISPFYNRTNQTQEGLLPNIVFFGAMNRNENTDAVKWFIDQVFIPYQLSELVSLTIVGAGASEAFIKKYQDVKNLIFTGFVESPEEHFKTALCMVVPLTYGGGIKIKVLEAMSSSVTVLSNNIGIEGIKAQPDVSYLHCSSPADYNDAIRRLSNNISLAYSIGEEARLMMESNYNFDHSYITYRNSLLKLVESK